MGLARFWVDGDILRVLRAEPTFTDDGLLAWNLKDVSR
jgi:hypothetical protein